MCDVHACCDMCMTCMYMYVVIMSCVVYDMHVCDMSTHMGGLVKDMHTSMSSHIGSAWCDMSARMGFCVWHACYMHVHACSDTLHTMGGPSYPSPEAAAAEAGHHWEHPILT